MFKVLRNRRFRAAVLGTAIAASLGLGAPGVLAAERQAFELPAQGASDAIRAVAQQAGVQIMAPESDLRGVTTRPVAGEYAPADALREMLEGTGLVVTTHADGSITIRREQDRAAAAVTREPVAGPGAETELDRVIVTGSRIGRFESDTLQSTIETTSEEIDRRGYTNIGQALQDTPGFAAPASSPVGTTQGALGVAQTFVNFFGLGSQRTLTLVNGRRFVSSNTVSGSGGATSPGSQVDLNVIPAGLVDRIETVAIGGAPVYGADAIAGTVNVILKDDFEGAQATLQYGLTDRGDAESFTARALMGGNFADGRGNAVVALEHNEQKGILLSSRMPFRYLVPNPLNQSDSDGIPSRIVVNDTVYSVMTEGGLPYDSALAPLLGFDLPGAVLPPIYTRPNYIHDANDVPLQFGANGELVPFRTGVPMQSALEAPVLTDGGDGVRAADHFSLLSPNKRTLLNALGHLDITPNVTAFVESTYVHTTAQEMSELYQYAAPGALGGPQLSFSVDNPFLSQAARDILVDNGLSTFYLNRNLNDIVDGRAGRTEQDLYRVVTGVRGEFDAIGDKPWNWDVAYNYGRNKNISSLVYIDPARLLAAADAVRDADGNIVCASGGSCVPINLFGTHNFSAEAADYVTRLGYATSVNTQQVWTANLSGAFPIGIGGPLAFNVGAEYRKEAGRFDPDATLRDGNILIGPGIGGFEGVDGSFTTKEVYGEFLAPVIPEDSGNRFAKAMSIEGAVRRVDNSLAGTDVTWSLGGRFAPAFDGWGDGLVLRAVYTHAIRAPAITELFLGAVPISSGITDPCAAANFTRGNNPAVREANCRAALAAVGVAGPEAFNPTTTAVSAQGIRSGNVDLRNEVADSWSAGFVYQPVRLPRLRVAVDWSDISLKGGIQSLAINTLLAACYDSENYPNEAACSSFQRLDADAAAAQPGANRVAGDIANGFRTGFYNISTLNFSGLIAAAEYRIPAGPGDIRLGSRLFYTHQFETLTQPGAQPVDTVGQIGTPEYRGSLSLGYATLSTEIDLQGQWTSSVVADNLATIEDLPAEANHIGDYWRFNLSLGYWFTDSFKAQLAVSNLFDRQVPYAAQVFRSLGSYDPIGRSYALRLSYTF